MNLKENETLALICHFARSLYRASYTEPEWIQLQIGSIEKNCVTIHALKHIPATSYPLKLPTLTISITETLALPASQEN